jgi:hypothetical protein
VDYRLLHRVLARISAAAFVRGGIDLNRPAKSVPIRLNRRLALGYSGTQAVFNAGSYVTVLEPRWRFDDARKIVLAMHSGGFATVV